MKIILILFKLYFLFLIRDLSFKNNIYSTDFKPEQIKKYSFRIKERIWSTVLHKKVKTEIERYKNKLEQSYQKISDMKFNIQIRFDKLLQYFNDHNKNDFDLMEEILTSFYLKKLDENKANIVKKLNSINNN